MISDAGAIRSSGWCRARSRRSMARFSFAGSFNHRSLTYVSTLACANPRKNSNCRRAISGSTPTSITNAATPPLWTIRRVDAAGVHLIPSAKDPDFSRRHPGRATVDGDHFRAIGIVRTMDRNAMVQAWRRLWGAEETADRRAVPSVARPYAAARECPGTRAYSIR